MPAVRALKERLGDEAMSDLQSHLDDTSRRCRDDVLMMAAERFERRLAEEIGALRVDMARQFAEMRAELLKWSFLFWVGQFAAVSAMMAFLLRTAR